MAKFSITFEQVDFQYPNHRIFSDLNFELTSNQITALHAPNGAGKTTLLYLLANMIKPEKGKITIRVDDKPITSQETYFKNMGVSFIDQFIMKDFSIQENISLFSSFYSTMDKNYVHELIDLLQLKNHLSKKCRFLSQGELKKVSLLKAMMSKPSFLFLDEPTNGLDARSKDLLLEHLKGLDSLMLIASHDRDWSCEVSKQIWTIEDRGVHVL